MSFIARTGNLMAAPELRQNPESKRYYCFARVAVNDRAQDANGEWKNTAMTVYNLTVSGSQAISLCDAAARCGNIAIDFTGNYRVTEYERKGGGTGRSHNVRVDQIGVSLKNQAITVIKPTKDAPAAEVDDARESDWDAMTVDL